ncbi:mRNA-decapping enzyme 1A [Liparis tanakae]|uniref:5'-(N(7)-methylguanosine 5'-triphospho)-[mRNA] hydrolase n=1 Tax=Liparis tanakae TaxID=230148 RepID=A0A4Z2H5Z3_9TELE|nr:mRNA-decapping enzyme 1A [Liparis tanakae]
METVNAGQMMSLAALQRQDPYINKLLDVTGQVALYNFNSKVNEWEKTDIEGTLFVYARSASPHHGFTIMNRLSTENLVEPINKDLEFQLQDPFLLYRNGNCEKNNMARVNVRVDCSPFGLGLPISLPVGIYSIWFYDKRDCHRIAQLMVKIVKQEAEHAQRTSPERAAPTRPNGVAEPRPIDILELLSKAKEEYQRAQAGEDVSAEPNGKAALNAAVHAHSKPQPEKSSHTMVKQITVEELFGSSFTKDPPLPGLLAQNTTSASSDSDPSTAYLHNQSYPTAAHPNPLFPPHLSARDPGSSQRHQVPGLLPAPYAMPPGPVFRSVVPRSDPQPQCSVSPLMVLPAGLEARAAPPVPAAPSSAPTAYLGQEILNTLKAAVPSVNSDIHKPILAPNFLPSALFPPHSFQEPMSKHLLKHSSEMNVFSQPPNLIKPMSAVPMSPCLAVPVLPISVLLSPSAFQQSISKTAASAAPPAPAEPSCASAGALEPPQAACSKTQLQDTLIHLIKNDPDFLGAIHDAYLRTLSKGLSNMTL